MNFDWSISPAVVWMLIGGLLILAEFALPGVIAVFFGVAALVVAIVLLLGVPLGLNAQLLLFGALAVALLLLVRGRVKGWFSGGSDASAEGVDVVPYGTMVIAVNDFNDGLGLVTHRGAHWSAQATEPVFSGQRLWICGRQGLMLRVSTQPPTGTSA